MGKSVKDTVTLTRAREYWDKFCNSGWSGTNIKECPQFTDMMQSDESYEPYCEMWGHYLENATREQKGIVNYRPLRCEKCLKILPASKEE